VLARRPQYIEELDALLSVSLDTTICSMDLRRGQTRETYRFHSKPVHCLAWIPGPHFALLRWWML
jgi:WD40 repeat protein